MLRLIVFFVSAVVLASLLGHLPIVGPFFARTSCVGIWISAMLLSWGIAKYGERAVRMRKDASEMRRLRAVDNPYTRGKLGVLYLLQGRTKKAIPELERAVEGEPEVAEWSYRLGCALLARGRADDAVGALRRAVAIDEEHAFGAAQLRLAEALMRSQVPGGPSAALEALATFERNHGPSPESAYRRGVAWKKRGDPEEAKRAFGEVSRLAAEAARYQRKAGGFWSLRATLASLF